MVHDHLVNAYVPEITYGLTTIRATVMKNHSMVTGFLMPSD